MGHWFNSCQRACSLWMYIIWVGSCCTLLSLTIGGNKIRILLTCLVYLNACIRHFHWLPSSFAVTIGDWLFFIRFLCTSPDFIDGLAVLFQNSKVLNLSLCGIQFPSLLILITFLCAYSACFETLSERGVVPQLPAVLKVYMLEFCIMFCFLFFP